MNTIFYNRVKYYFLLKFPEAYLIFGPDALDNGRYKYINDALKEFKEVFGAFVNMDAQQVDAVLDQELDKFLNNYLTESERKNCRKICEYIYERHNKDKSKYGVDIYDHIVKSVGSRVFRQYEYMIKEGKSIELLGDEIDKLYKRECSLIESELRNITKLIVSEIVLPLDFFKYNIKENVLIEKVMSYVYRKRHGRRFLDSLHHSIAEKDENNNVTKLMRSDSVKDLCKYINSLVYIKKLQSSVDSHEKMRNNREHEVLHKVSGNVESVQGTKTSRKVENPYDEVFTMRKNSVSTDRERDRQPYNYRTRKITKPVITLLVLATLVGVGRGMIKSHKDDEAITRVEEFDDFDYDKYDRKNKLNYEFMADNVIDFYNNVDQLENDNFDMLSFYRAVDSNLEDEDLDELLRVLKERASQSSNRELKFYFSNESCYLEFIYDQLKIMGCEELKDKYTRLKYENAILAYKHSTMANVYGIAEDNLSQDEMKVISEIKDLYKEYCKKYMIDLGYMIDYDENGNLVLNESYLRSNGGHSI